MRRRSLLALVALAAIAGAPRARAEIAAPPGIVVAIETGGRIRVGRDVIDEPALTERARSLVARFGDRVEARISAASDVPYATVVRVMDLLRAAGITRISMLPSPSASPPAPPDSSN